MLYEKKCIWAVGVIRTYFYGWQVWTNSLIFLFAFYCISCVADTLNRQYRLWVLSDQQKFAVWNFGNSTFPMERLRRPDPSHIAFGYCSCKQDTKEGYWGQQFCQMEREISVQPTEMTRLVKEDHLLSWSRICQSDQTEIVRSIWCTNQNFRNFGLNGKRPIPVV